MLNEFSNTGHQVGGIFCRESGKNDAQWEAKGVEGGMGGASHPPSPPRCVLVTGGTMRLGLAIANHLREKGWHVITTSHRPDALADIIADLTEPMGPARAYLAATQLNHNQPLDAVINNAALFQGPTETLQALNFTAPQKLTIFMAARETGRGHVIIILDAQCLDETAALSPYLQTKRDLLDYTHKSAALFEATLNVNAVAPGSILAPTNVHMSAALSPRGRPTSEAVAHAVAFLLESPFTTDCIIPVS